MKLVPIQFMPHDGEAGRLGKLRRLAEQIADVANAPQAVTATGGAEWFTGTGPPSAGLGEPGDFYLDTASGDVYELEA